MKTSNLTSEGAKQRFRSGSFHHKTSRQTTTPPKRIWLSVVKEKHVLHFIVIKSKNYIYLLLSDRFCNFKNHTNIYSNYAKDHFWTLLGTFLKEMCTKMKHYFPYITMTGTKRSGGTMAISFVFFGGFQQKTKVFCFKVTSSNTMLFVVHSKWVSGIFTLSFNFRE